MAPSSIVIFVTLPSEFALNSFCILSVSLRDTRDPALIRLGRHKNHKCSASLHCGALLYRDLGYSPR